jgi:hypothetical protein
MTCLNDCSSKPWRPRLERGNIHYMLDECGMCGGTFHADTMVSNPFRREEWLCDCCTRPAGPFRVFRLMLASLLRPGP